MAIVEERLAKLGLTLPPPLTPPPGIVLRFPWVHIREGRAFVSGHLPQEPDGHLAGPFGKVGREVTVDDAVLLARKTGLGMIASLARELGDLDRISGWNRVFGMVNSTPDFDRQPVVLNGFSELVLEAFGPDVGRHARSAVGMAALPLGVAVEIEGSEVLKEVPNFRLRCHTHGSIRVQKRQPNLVRRQGCRRNAFL